MSTEDFPITLARGMMRALPPPLLEHGARALLRKMQRNHPDLFASLGALDRATIRFAPTDVPHAFLMTIGEGAPRLTLARADAKPVNVTVKGPLESLLALFEGRIDGDALFFTREISITGDTAAVVGLRNTLDRETISLADEAAALLGPFKRPGLAAARRLDRRAQQLRARFAPPPAAGADSQSLAAHNAALRAEVETLKAWLAKHEVRNRRAGEAAA